MFEAQHKGCVTGAGWTRGGKSPRGWSQTGDGPGSHGSTLDFTEGGGEILKGLAE